MPHAPMRGHHPDTKCASSRYLLSKSASMCKLDALVAQQPSHLCTTSNRGLCGGWGTSSVRCLSSRASRSLLISLGRAVYQPFRGHDDVASIRISLQRRTNNLTLATGRRISAADITHGWDASDRALSAPTQQRNEGGTELQTTRNMEGEVDYA